MATKKDDSLTREGAGNWRTKDGRFLIRGESGGHWYLIDDLRRDPFGLELVSGPYATVAAAREAIALARADFPDGSGVPGQPSLPEAEAIPLASKHGEAAGTRRRPSPGVAPRKAPETAAATQAPAGAPRKAPEKAPEKAAATQAPAGAPRKAPEKAPSAPAEPAAIGPAATAAEPPPAAAEEPREPAWMEALPTAGRRAARRSIEALDRLGVEDAAGIVGTDLTTDTPAVARAILLRRIASLIAEAPDPAAARAIVADVLRLLTVAGRAASDNPALPSWHLAEDRPDRPGRPITLDADDLAAALDGGPDDHAAPR